MSPCPSELGAPIQKCLEGLQSAIRQTVRVWLTVGREDVTLIGVGRAEKGWVCSINQPIKRSDLLHTLYCIWSELLTKQYVLCSSRIWRMETTECLCLGLFCIWFCDFLDCSCFIVLLLAIITWWQTILNLTLQQTTIYLTSLLKLFTFIHRFSLV